MKDKKQKTRGAVQRSFNPDVLVTSIHQILMDDLGNSLLPRVHHTEVYEPAAHHFVKTQLQDFTKKYEPKTTDKTIDKREAAFKKFRANSDRLSDVALAMHFGLLPSVLPGGPNRSSETARYLLRARAFCHLVLRPFTAEEFATRCHHSGGTTLGVKFNQTNIEDKFKPPMTGTKDAIQLFTNLILGTDDILARAFWAQSVDEQGFFKVVEGSRTTSVPKNDTIDRIIAIEPTVNMFLQQGLMELMVDLLKPWLDLEKLQDKHKFSAWLSSITRRFATIDWSSASDSVLVELIKFLFPPQWYYALMSVRSPKTQFSSEGRFEDLPMISTMGNATTFPVETLVFLSLAVAVSEDYQFLHSTLPNVELKSGVSIYGDDCILPSHKANSFISLCEYVGFTVNVEKTFIDETNPFRESCGGDYFAGRNVRPYHIKAPHNCKITSLEPWLYIQVNNLLEKYKSYFGDLTYMYHMDSILTYICDYFRRENLSIKFVPSDYPDDSGIQVKPDFLRLYTTLNAKCVEFSPIYMNTSTGLFHKLPWNKLDVGTLSCGLYEFKSLKFKYTLKLPVCPHFRYWGALSEPSVQVPTFGKAFVRAKALNIYPLKTAKNLEIWKWDYTYPICSKREDLAKVFGQSKRVGGYNVVRSWSSVFDKSIEQIAKPKRR